MTTTAALKVGVVEDDREMRERVVRAISAEPAMEVLFACETAAETLAALESESAVPPDVMLVDLGLPDVPGAELIRRVRKRLPACDILVFTLFADEISMLEAFAAGARGALLKDGADQDLARHVRDLRAGGSPLSPLVARRLLGHWAHGLEGQTTGPTALTTDPAALAQANAQAPLTPRELEVLQLISRGFRTDEVASRLGVAATTVRTHVRNVYAKLDVHSQTEAVFEARALGWLR